MAAERIFQQGTAHDSDYNLAIVSDTVITCYCSPWGAIPDEAYA